jgi:hypothetical protein
MTTTDQGTADARAGARGIVDERYAESGVAGIALETDRLRLTVFPDAGAKILDLVHVPTGENLLWRNPRVPLRATYPGPAFDDVWCGGWDELFPTDTACELDGNTFHDHGDLWHGPWEWRVAADDGETATLHLRRPAVALPCLMEKWVTVRRGSPAVSFRHRLANLGTQRVPFAWNIHVAHAIDPGSRLHVATDAMHAVAAQPGRFGGRDAPVPWPGEDGGDLTSLPPTGSGLTEWLYAAGLREGRCSVVHPARGVGLELAFDPDVFRTVWTWGVYGGWRGHYVLLTEPSTSPPGGLAANVADGTAAWLDPGGVLETDVVATVLEAPFAGAGS